MERMRIVTWNVDGLRAMLARRNQSLSTVLQGLNADIVCLQETKFTRTDMQKIQDFVNIPGWKSFVGLCRIRQGYAGVVTFCKPSIAPVAAEEGLSQRGGDKDLSNSIGWQDSLRWQSFQDVELQHNDNEGRCMITDHGGFVLFHLYGPAVTDIHAERFPRKLTFYKALQLRCRALISQGRRVIIAGDLNIASRPDDQYKLAHSTVPPAKLLQDFFQDRPDRQWFREFLDESGTIDMLRHFHPKRKGAYTVWGRQHEERKRNLGYRVDYIILAEPAKAGIASKPTPEDLEQDSLLTRCTGCDILTEFHGSDHAPVWLEFQADRGTQATGLPRLESSTRFRAQKGNQRDLSSYFHKPKKAKVEESNTQESTPPRKGEVS